MNEQKISRILFVHPLKICEQYGFIQSCSYKSKASHRPWTSAINYIVTDKDLIKIKVNMLKQMHEVMLNMNDERYYEEWIVLGMPDEPNEDDFESVAENPEKWVETVNFFAKLTADNEMERYEEY